MPVPCLASRAAAYLSKHDNGRGIRGRKYHTVAVVVVLAQFAWLCVAFVGTWQPRIYTRLRMRLLLQDFAAASAKPGEKILLPRYGTKTKAELLALLEPAEPADLEKADLIRGSAAAEPEEPEKTKPNRGLRLKSSAAEPAETYNGMTLPQLQAMLKERNLILSGKKADLIARLKQSDRSQGVHVNIVGEDLMHVSTTNSASADVFGTWPELTRLPDRANSWSLAMSSAPALLRWLTASEDELPQWVLQAWRAAGKMLTSNGDDQAVPSVRYANEMPAAFRESLGQLHPHQLEAVRFGIARGGRMLCGDEMGLGKTLAAIALAYEYKEEWPVLVICPASLRLHWKTQILKWLGHVVEEDDVQVIATGADRLSGKAKMIIMSYNSISLDHFQKMSTGKRYKVIICDESHSIKDTGSKRTKACISVLSKASRVTLLSGTPSLNNAHELYTQLVAVLGQKHFPVWKVFAERYCNQDRKTLKHVRRPWKRDIVIFKGVRRDIELGVLLRSLMLRRKKDEVMAQLPAKHRRRIILPEVSAKITRADDVDMSDMERLSEGFERLCNAKIESTQKYLTDILGRSTAKTLLFAHHHAMLDAVQQTLEKINVSFVQIHGRTSMRKRHAAVESFQEDLSVQCALLSITACSQGISLTAASQIIFCEMYWVPGVMEQCESRAHRYGQRVPVDVQYLVVKRSIDEALFAALSSKKIATSVVLDGKVSRLQASTEVNGAMASADTKMANCCHELN